MYEKEFAERLAKLRTKKDVSARDMNLSLGQNPGYINAIENGKAFPTMSSFFNICEYLQVEPKDFFDWDCSTLPHAKNKLNNLTEQLQQLSEKQLVALSTLVSDLAGINHATVSKTPKSGR